jgi:predicted RND superfamily exporter protein
MSETLSKFLVAARIPLLVVAFTLTLAAIPFAGKLTFNRSIEAMFAADDPMLAPYRMVRRVFGGNEVALVAYVDPHVLEPAGLDRLERLTTALAKVPGIEAVFSLTSSPVVGKAILDSPMRDRFLKLCEGYVLGPDHETAGVACLLEPFDVAGARSETIGRLRAVVAEQVPEAVVTGEPVLVLDGFRRLDEDALLLGATSTALLMGVIIICFRSVRWVIVPLAVMAATLVWTQALLAIVGYRLSMVSSMLWALVTVICVGTVMHVIVGFRAARQRGLDAPAALVATGVSLGGPIFWSCATDAVGFGSLMIAHVGPVQDFGAMMSLASLLALVAMALLIPGFALLGKTDADPQRAWGEARLDHALDGLSQLIEKRPRGLTIALTLIIAASVSGIPFLQVETDFTRNFRASSPLVKAYMFVESRLGGAGLLDVVVPIEGGLNDDILERVRILGRRLEAEVVVHDDHGVERPGLTKTLSLADVLDVGAQRMTLGMPVAARVALLERAMPLASALHATDPESGVEYLRIMLRARERQPAAEKERLIEQVNTITHEVFPDAEVTGFFVLLTRLIASVSRDQWLTFGVATVAIALMLRGACGNWRLAIVALVPNALPILMVTGLMGWLGFKINMGAAMIASVSMGLSVDSSIHWLTDFRRHRELGRSIDESIGAAHQQVGRAMVFSTVALCVGFGALCTSEFVPTITFGALVSLAMLGGLAGNLMLLPLLVKWVEPSPPLRLRERGRG